MSKVMLIDAVHPEEVRVAVVNKGQVEDFDFESASKRQLRGNIYLAKVTRVEPSLQAAFVDFGGNRHGFLAFNEIHPDYYQLPQADREALLAEAADQHTNDDADVDDPDEDGEERPTPSHSSPSKKYKIQEVIRRRQIMLVQAVKEERGTKGAALTTYLSLAGRYCVLMPNTPRGGGISRKITNATDRKRLKKIVAELNVPEGMGLIVRTAGAKRTKTEIKRDFEYLIRLWSKIRELTLTSVAPCVINEEAGLVHRALRDMYDKDIDQVVVDGDGAYREAKDLVKMLMPSHSKKVKQQKSGVPVFAEYNVEPQLNTIFNPTVQLRSGGYLVIHQTEALVAIDVNSGKSTRERNIEQTALRTNLEAAEEACRQMRLRDLAGLVVIDFIDMEEGKNNRAVERRMKDCLKLDRARVQNNKISMFGLMEISRQRRRAGVLDSSSEPCSHCNGTGHVRSIESSGLQLLRAMEGRVADQDGGQLTAEAPTEVVLFLLNEKRTVISELEKRHNLLVQVSARGDMRPGDFELTLENADGETVEAQKYVPPKHVESKSTDDDSDIDADEKEVPSSSSGSRRRRRRSRRPEKDLDKSNLDALDDPMASSEGSEEASDGPVDLIAQKSDDAEENNKRRRRRGRRGGRRRKSRDSGGADLIAIEDNLVTEDGGAVLDATSASIAELVGDDVTVEAEPNTVEAETTDEALELPAKDSEAEQPATAEPAKEASEKTESAQPETSESDQVLSDATSESTPESGEPESPPAELVASEKVAEEPAETPAPEVEPEPAVLPETEKPKTLKRGWWGKRKTG